MIVLFLLFAAGLMLGSFYYVAGIRIPVGISLAAPLDGGPSGWRKLSYPYLLTIVATGLLFTGIPLLVDRSEWLVAYSLVSLLIMLSVSDISYKLLPNKLIYPGLLLFLLLRLCIHPLPLWQYAVGFLVGGGSLLTVSLISLQLGRSAMGGGDIKLMALMGLALGLKHVVLTIFFSSLLGSMLGIFGIATGILKRDSVIPYGPFIATGGIIAYFIGEQVIDLYFSLVYFWE